jgi:hypothetical protein
MQKLKLTVIEQEDAHVAFLKILESAREHGILDFCQYERIQSIYSKNKELIVDSIEQLFQDLSITIPNKKQFDLSRQIRAECDKTESIMYLNQRATSRLQLLTFPESLLVYLIIFNKELKKINGQPTIDFQVSLKNLANDVAQYELVAIILHIGRYQNGHYVTIGKRNQNWFLFNDTEVQIITIEQIRDFVKPAKKPYDSVVPYMFFYQRVNIIRAVIQPVHPLDSDMIPNHIQAATKAPAATKKKSKPKPIVVPDDDFLS